MFEDQDFYNDMEDSFNDFEYEYGYNELEQKKQMFDQQYASFPLKKTTSHGAPDSLEKGLSNDRQLSLKDKNHKKIYLMKIAENSQILLDRIL